MIGTPRELVSRYARPRIAWQGANLGQVYNSRQKNPLARPFDNACIAATMPAHRERRRLTFNTRDFRRFGEKIELVEIEGVE